jgi:sigma-54 dependent transcriptional regulator, acetoin dehydrogenase operon transcriptional activator AcoR
MKTLFFDRHEDRVALARRQYFEEGQVPSGVVPDAVLQSWGVCLRAKRSIAERVEFQPVSVSRSHLAMQKNAALCAVWQKELRALESTIKATGCEAILTDASGVLIGVAGGTEHHGSVLKAAHRVGVNLSEAMVGTTAPGLVIRTGKVAMVRGGEHYFERVGHMHCAAAPIRDIHGQLTGVLDFSSEGAPFRFDVTSVLGYFASTIESRLVLAQSDQHLIVRLQMSEALLDTPLCGLVGVNLDGGVAWCNATAANLLGFPSSSPIESGLTTEHIFACSLSALLSMRGGGHMLRLPNGLSVCVRCELHAKDGGQSLVQIAAPHRLASGLNERDEPSTTPDVPATANARSLNPEESSATTLRDADGDLIARTLVECKGNVSAASRKLKVSRGLIYRHVKRQKSPDIAT